MIDGTQEALPVRTEVQINREKAKAIADDLNKAIADLPVQSRLSLDRNGTPSVLDNHKDGGAFRFWGSVEPRFTPTHYSSTTAILKDVKLPDGVQGLSWGRTIVNAWEKAAVKRGIKYFAVTNPKAEAMGFWEKMGYVVPASQQNRDNPYCMIKALG